MDTFSGELDSLSSHIDPLPISSPEIEASTSRYSRRGRKAPTTLGVQETTLTVPSFDRPSYTRSDINSESDELSGSERPVSVLSRPFSSLSRASQKMVDSAVNIPTFVANILRKKAQKARGRVDSSSSLSSDTSNDYRDDGIQSRMFKEQLDSYAGSRIPSAIGTGPHKWHHNMARKWRKIKEKVLVQHSCHCTYLINPHGTLYLWWMGFVFLTYLYNAIGIPLRASFSEVQGLDYPDGQLNGPPQVVRGWLLALWIVCDLFCDAVYILDIILIQVHLSYNQEKKRKEKVELKTVIQYYLFHWTFVLDTLSLLPLEVLYAVPVLRFNPLLRLPRLLRVRHVYIFFSTFEHFTNYPHTFRMIKVNGYLIYVIHLYTCIYYSVSLRAGFGSNDWVYDGEGNGYLHCFYWALLTVTTIHDQALINPTDSIEYIVQMFGYLFGVFLIAIIISEISSIVQAANAPKNRFRYERNQLNRFMREHNIPKKTP